MSDGGGGVEGQQGEGLRGLWGTTGDRVNIQIPGTGDDGGRWKLAVSDGKPSESAGELGVSVADSKPGGGEQEGVGEIILGGGAGGADVWGRDVGTYP